MPLPDSITHYHYPDKAPFLNLSELDAETRAPVLAALNARADEGHTLRAFPEWYMPQRLEAEATMRALYTAKFGKPERPVPHYFARQFAGAGTDLQKQFPESGTAGQRV